ncbi:MAG TPA: DedA family protein [Melioribacteraceae bacterium]|nr:DedA family protein [Melioribacteraceae bacterium]
MFEQILEFLKQADTTVIYSALLLFSFIENVFPPSPSDVVVIIGSGLIANNIGQYFYILIGTSVFSALGFVVMYYVGHFFGEKILRHHRLKFIKDDDLIKTDNWFKKYGYYLIIGNRFLPGTRSVISFFAGVHRLNVINTFLAASVSAFLWNAIIIYAGYLLGNNIAAIDKLFSTYSSIIIVITILIIIYIIFRIKKVHKKLK